MKGRRPWRLGAAVSCALLAAGGCRSREEASGVAARESSARAERVIRGGSWMCAENFCGNYRVAARGHATPDTGLDNLGFRCARDAAPGDVGSAARP